MLMRLQKYPARPPRMNCTDMLVGSLSAIGTLQTWYGSLGILVQHQTDEYGQQHIRYLISVSILFVVLWTSSLTIHRPESPNLI